MKFKCDSPCTKMLAVILKEGTEFSPGRGRGFLGGGLRKFASSDIEGKDRI